MSSSIDPDRPSDNPPDGWTTQFLAFGSSIWLWSLVLHEFSIMDTDPYLMVHLLDGLDLLLDELVIGLKALS